MVGWGRLKGPKTRLMSKDMQDSCRVLYQVQGSGQTKWVECLWPMGTEEEEDRVGAKGKYKPGAARQNWSWEGSAGMGSLSGPGAGGKISRCHMWVQWQRRSDLRQGQNHLQEVPDEHWLELWWSAWETGYKASKVWVRVEVGSLT